MKAVDNPSGYDRPIGPWERRLQQGVVRRIALADLRGWIVSEDEHILAIDKPGDFVCHPSKDGPWSSLSGAVREYLGGGSAHLVFRLDRETSGLVIYAKNPDTARRLQMAAQERRYAKTYLALLVGELRESLAIDRPLGPDLASPVLVKSRVVPAGEGQEARTQVVPVAAAGGFTLARIRTETGRKHQIRAHLQWAGYPLVGDKIYGPDPRLFLDFIEHGWTPRLAEVLFLERQALHCAEIDLRPAGLTWRAEIPLAADLRAFAERHGIAPPAHLP